MYMWTYTNLDLYVYVNVCGNVKVYVYVMLVTKCDFLSGAEEPQIFIFANLK